MVEKVKTKSIEEIHTNEICIKPDKHYILRLYRELMDSPIYNKLSAVDKECLDIHVNTMLNGIQYYSSVSCETIAKIIGCSKDVAKASNKKLRDLNFLVISDITSNRGRNTYAYCYQLKDKTKKYYYDGYQQRTFKKKIYISTIDKRTGVIHRNTHVESDENRKLRLAGEYFCSWGIPNPRINEGKTQVMNPEYKKENLSFLSGYTRHLKEWYSGADFGIADSFDLEDSNDSLYLESSYQEIPNSAVAESDENSTTKKKSAPKSKKLPKKRKKSTKNPLTFGQNIDRSEEYYYSIIGGKLNSLNNHVNNQFMLGKYSPLYREFSDKDRRKLFSLTLHNGLTGYAYVKPNGSTSAYNNLAIANAFYQGARDYLDCSSNPQFILHENWLDAGDMDNEALAMLLLVDGQNLLPCKGKVPYYRYICGVEENSFGMLGKQKKFDKIFQNYGGEWGLDLNGDLVCLDFDSEEEFGRMLERFPQIGESLIKKTTRGYHVFFRVTNRIRNLLPKKIKARLFGIEVDCLSKGFVRFSTTEFYNSNIPLILPYEIFQEWREVNSKVEIKPMIEKSNYGFNSASNFKNKLNSATSQIFYLGERNSKAYSLLRGLRFGLDKQEYDELAAGIYGKFDQSEDYYEWKDFVKMAEYAWKQPNTPEFEAERRKRYARSNGCYSAAK